MLCPRCGTDSLAYRAHSFREQACTNRLCRWPDPEPGTIHLLRWRLRGRADVVLQRMRRQGIWPRVP